MPGKEAKVKYSKHIGFAHCIGSEFIEGILDSYLKQKKIHWRPGKPRP